MLRLVSLCLIMFLTISVTGQTISHSIPSKTDREGKYLFYLHGRIIEDQGIHAVSPQYGSYEYENIIETFSKAGLHVISEPRPKNTDPDTYAEKVSHQIDTLLSAGVKPGNIIVMGASKGGGITLLTACKLANPLIRFVVMGVCTEESASFFKENNLNLCGEFFSIYEKSDSNGSCIDLFNSQPCVSRYEELELTLGNGHGFLYKPYAEWVQPVLQWINTQRK